MKRVSISFGDELHKEVRHKVVDLDSNIQTYVIELIKKDLKEAKEKCKK